jgi:hypothetical protein
MTRPQRVTVTINRLVLRGFAPHERDAVAAGLAAELRAQFGDAQAVRGLGGSRSIATIRSRHDAPAGNPKPVKIGAAAANSMVRSMKP